MKDDGQKTLFDAGFYQELEASLPLSTEEQRTAWAKHITDNNLNLKTLFNLLTFDHKTATRFLWLLSNIGMQNPQKLSDILPVLFEKCEKDHPEYLYAFATYWRLVGVPTESEGKAIDLLFNLLLSANVNSSIKSRAIFVLFELSKKHPEIIGEFKTCLLDQMDKYTKDFKKRIAKILGELEVNLSKSKNQ